MRFSECGRDALCDGFCDGLPGVDSDDGIDGESCTAKPVKNEAGVEGLEVTCGKTVVGMIWNGVDGKDGDNSVGCSVKDEGDGMVTVTCGDADPVILFKAVCDMEPYDPAKSFCSGGEVYELCDGKTYDLKEQYCLKVTRGETDIYSVEALLTDARDNQVYKTVEICNEVKSSCQTWMAQNLNYSVNPGEQSLCYMDSEEYCEKYGRLYTWAAAIDSVALAHDFENSQTCGYGKTCTLPAVVQGVCPAGWHLPSKAEWDTLFTYVGGKPSAGTVLKSTSGWNDDINGGDDYGFAVLPAGYTNFDNYFYAIGDDAYFWSSTEEADSHAYSENFHYSYSGVNEYYEFPKYKGFSVRCLRNF